MQIIHNGEIIDQPCVISEVFNKYFNPIDTLTSHATINEINVNELQPPVNSFQSQK